MVADTSSLLQSVLLITPTVLGSRYILTLVSCHETVDVSRIAVAKISTSLKIVDGASVSLPHSFLNQHHPYESTLGTSLVIFGTVRLYISFCCTVSKTE
jgi:ABC-type glucose/galactose transport system permease subunit